MRGGMLNGTSGGKLPGIWTRGYRSHILSHGSAPPAAGKSSQKTKEGLIVKLLASSKGNETGYVIRSLQVGGGEGGGGEEREGGREGGRDPSPW